MTKGDRKNGDSRIAAEALERVTDYVEEKEMDQVKVQKAIAELHNGMKKAKIEKKKLERKLASVKVNEGDVQILIQEFEVDKKVADIMLREHDGNLERTIQKFLNL